jgi:CheY-like chemotaxis protein
LFHCPDGEEGILLLQQLQAQNKLPVLIVLDINMPKFNGKEIAYLLKNDASFNKIPVVVISNSSLKADISYFEKLGIPVINKSYSLTTFVEDVRNVLCPILSKSINDNIINKRFLN